jgi:lipopolysaccharide exporter
MNLRQKAASGLRWTSLATFFKSSLQILRSIALARLLVPEDFGLMGMVMIAVGFAEAYTDVGISAAIIHRQDATKDELSTLYWLNIISGIIVLFLFWILIPVVIFIFKEPRLENMLQLVSIVFIIVPIGKQFEILLQKELHFNILARQEIFASITGLSTAVIFAIYGFGAWSLIFAFIIETFMKTLLLVQSGLRRFRPCFHFKRQDLKGYLRFGLFQTGERTVNFISERLDQVIIGSLLGAHSLGYYYFAFNLVLQPISRINPIVTKVAFPVFSKIQGDIGKLKKAYLQVVNVLTTINAPILIGMAAVSPIAIPIIFGQKWVASIMLVQILSFVSLARSTGNPIGSLQLARGRADLGFKWNLFLLIISIPIISLGGLLGGAVGVALALMLMQISLYVPSYLWLVKPLIGECVKEYASSITEPISRAAIMGLTVFLISFIIKNISAYWQLSIQIATGIIVYFVLFCVFDQKNVHVFKSILFSRSAER